MLFKSTLAAAAVLAMTACASHMGSPAMMYSQASLPDAVKVPAGHKVAWETVGVGQITYECKVKANMPGQHQRAFGGPDAKLLDRSGKQVGKYYGPPATWEAMDGSSSPPPRSPWRPTATRTSPCSL